MKITHLYRNLSRVCLTLACLGVLAYSAFATAKLSPTLQAQINGVPNTTSVGVVIVCFNTTNGLTNTHLNILRGLGVVNGVTFQRLGMVGTVLNAGQVRTLQNNAAVRSIWSNDQLRYYMNAARMVAGVDKLRSDPAMTARNGGFPVSGNGDFSVLLIDTGIDTTGADLPSGTKVIQNTQRVVSTDAGNTGITVGGVPIGGSGFTPSLSIENVPNSDNVGHGTHCAGIIGGLGSRSGGIYAGVAPGVKIVGSGGGAVIVVLDALAGWEYGLTHQDQYRIRVVSNSYGPIGGGTFDPNDPLMIAAKNAYDHNMTVVFAGGNDGPGKDTLSPYAQAPWIIGVAAGSKEGMLAGFSSRGLPREQRQNDTNPANDNEAPTLTAPGTGHFYDSNPWGFTADIVSVRASTGITALADLNDPELAPGTLAFYTEMSGTSMATPFTAGTIALMLDADPTLNPDQIKQILIDTATKMPGYSEWEVGAGYINAYAAVDKVYNNSKNFHNFSEATFNAQFGEQRPAEQDYHIDFDPTVSGENSSNSTHFSVDPDMNVLDVWARVDNIGEIGTGNFVGVRIWDPNGVAYGATSIPTPVIGTDVRETVVLNPVPGTWRLEVRGATGLSAVSAVRSPAQIASPGPCDITVTQVKYILPNIPDIVGHPQQAQIESALKNRVIDTYPDGTYRPDLTVTREDLARSLMLNAPVRQSIGSTPRFTDVSGDLARIAEAVTSRGSTLRDYNFVPTGMMSYTGNLFSPAASVNRLDLAVALVKALGHDSQAAALAGQPVMYQGTELSDDAQIPSGLRGYVQIALNDGLFEAYPAEVREISPGHFQAIPGPRFEAATTVNRATLGIKLNAFQQLFINAG